MTANCPHCGQPMPAEARRDPPLPPLDFPTLVTIHDLPPVVRASAEIIESVRKGDSVYTARRLALDKSIAGEAGR